MQKMLSFLLIFYFSAGVDVAARNAVVMAGEPYLHRIIRENHLETRARLIDDYNRLLGMIAAQEKMKAAERRRSVIPRQSLKLLKNAGRTLQSSLLLGRLRNHGTSSRELADIGTELAQAQYDLEQAESLWLRWKKLTKAEAEAPLYDACHQAAQKEHAPLSKLSLQEIESLIGACKTAPRIAIDGVLTTQDGRRSAMSRAEAPVRPIQLAGRTAGLSPRQDDSTVKTAAPGPAAVTQAPADELVPEPARLTEKEQAELSIKPTIPGMRMVTPPSRKALKAFARKLVKSYSASDGAAPRREHGLARFLLAAEAPDSSFKSIYEYSYALARWDDSIKRYRTDSPGVEELRALSHAEYWQDYRRKNAQLTDLMNNRGGNCEARTRLMIALFDRLRLKLPKDQELLVQSFSDHLQPVVYDRKKNTVYDLISGQTIDGSVVDLFDPMLLVNSWLKKNHPTEARDDRDFIRVRANKTPDPKFLVKNSGPGGAASNSTLKLPASDVRHSLGDPPESSWQPLSPRIATPVDTPPSAATANAAPTKPETSKGHAVETRKISLSARDGQSWKLDVALEQYNPSKLTQMTCSSLNECSTYKFMHRETYDKALNAKTTDEFLGFYHDDVARSITNSPAMTQFFVDWSRWLDDPAGLANERPTFAPSADWETLVQRLVKINPHYRQLRKSLQEFEQKAKDQPYLMAEIMSRPSNSERIKEIEHMRNRLALADPKKPLAFYAVILDARHSAWTIEDKARDRIDAKAKAHDRKKEPTQPNTERAEDSWINDPDDTSPWRDAKPAKARSAKDKTPVFVPKERILIKDIDLIVSALSQAGPIITSEQRDGLRRLWSPAFTKKSEEIRYFLAYADEWSLSSSQTANGPPLDWRVIAAFPEGERCEVYVPILTDDSARCLPAELAKIFLASARAEHEDPTTTYPIVIDGQRFHASLDEVTRFVKAQLARRPFRPDYDAAVARAKARGAQNPDILTDREIKQRLERQGPLFR